MGNMREVMRCAVTSSIAFFTPHVFGQAPGAGSETVPREPAAVEPGVTFFTGVRLWVNQFEVPTLQVLPVVDPNHPGTPLLQSVLNTNVSQTKVTPIPFFGLKAGNFVLAGSYFVSTSYDSGVSSIGSVDREEYDVSLGYSVIPSLVLSVGYKHASQNKLTEFSPSGVKIDAGLIGISASLPIAGKFSFYGNVAYGWGRNKYDFSSVSGTSSLSSTYRIGELGGSYLAYQGSAVKSILVSLGYRAQFLTTKGAPLDTVTFTDPPRVVDVQHQNKSSTTDGFIFGLTMVF